MNTKHVIVVGAGWAGLTAAIRLSEKGYQVTLLEAAPNTGGRARSVLFGTEWVDNGQHLLIGEYREFLALLKTIGIKENEVFSRMPLRLVMLTRNIGKTLELKLVNLPYPLNLILGFFRLKGFSLKEKWQMMVFLKKIKRENFELDQDGTVAELLSRHEQSESVVENLWAPLALAVLSTPIKYASAKVFIQVLQKAFLGDKYSSNFLFPKDNLSQLLPDPAIQFLKNNGQHVFCNQRALELIMEGERCVGVRTKHKNFSADAIILATPPLATAQLLSQKNCGALSLRLASFVYQPITTVYLKYSKAVTLPYPMIGLVGHLGHWVFDRGFCHQPNMISVVITGEGEHTALSNIMLVEKLSLELAALSLGLEKPIAFKVITEKRAAFSCEPDIVRKRPSNCTPCANVWLAGDYTCSNYPATLEGAVQSGNLAAQLVLLNN